MDNLEKLLVAVQNAQAISRWDRANVQVVEAMIVHYWPKCGLTQPPPLFDPLLRPRTIAEALDAILAPGNIPAAARHVEAIMLWVDASGGRAIFGPGGWAVAQATADRRRKAAERAEWQRRCGPGEPYPESREAWIALASRAGVPASYLVGDAFRLHFPETCVTVLGWLERRRERSQAERPEGEHVEATAEDATAPTASAPPRAWGDTRTVKEWAGHFGYSWKAMKKHLVDWQEEGTARKVGSRWQVASDLAPTSR
ncbi:MAG: hypothetical protein FJ290_10265 [Planctomycetes bacterium]|nr:hypothetical protein [Planctomycetota bacterium]